VTCDLIMPNMDGVQFVQLQMARRPLPIIIISIASGNGEQVLAALDAGAIDFVQKPTALATEKLLDISDELIEKVKAAAHAPVRARPNPAPAPSQRVVLSPQVDAASTDIVVIGASTGGPQALKQVIGRLPKNLPVPVAIVLHMPLGYTATYARKLDEASAITVRECEGNEAVEPGCVYVAPAGRHLTLVHGADGVVRTHLDVRPLDSLHRPSVDVLFQSAAEVYRERVLGVVLTGMGSDGREGAAWIKAAGGTVLAQTEDDCVVYGMPRSVVEAGLADGSVPLEDMAQAIIERL
jgi:two-component system chemotaxis response regulator CheB